MSASRNRPPSPAPGPLRAPSAPGPPDDPGPLSSPPCWATQALCDLARAETELRRLRERQATETAAVNRGVERAVLGARREERRLLERVEQDHRDAQRRLEQLQRENAAAARVGQSLLDQRLRKVAQLRELIQRSGRGLGRDQVDQNLLLKGTADLLQPWEISLSLKKVSFRPSSQPKAVTFGEIRVQEHDLCLPVGGCGPRGQLCPLHAGNCPGDADYSGGGAVGEGRSTPDGAGPALSSPSPPGNLRVVRKLRLSGAAAAVRSDEESGGEEEEAAPRTRRWPPTRRDASDRESSPEEEEEEESSTSDVFLAVPAASLSNGESEGEELRGFKAEGRSQALRNQRKPRTLVLVPGRQSSSSSPRGTAGHALTSSSSSSSPKVARSCLDLASLRPPGERPRSRLSVSSSDDHPAASDRGPSPADSLDSCYTFVVSSPRGGGGGDRGSSLGPRLSKSAADLTRKTPGRPLVNGGRGDHAGGAWRVNRSGPSSTATPRAAVAGPGRTLSCPGHGEPGVRHCGGASPSRVSRSLSMSVIDGPSLDQGRGRGERGGGGASLVEAEEEADRSSSSPLPPHAARLLRQFGKQGSGRADLTLPSGVHATPQGQLFVVDCGNARVQVTDPRGNVLQQVAPSSSSDGSARRCRNYFDVAVNAKGLIALSCAAERALLVFSRHGRLLQTFGGSAAAAAAGGVARDELEAPRGVTVTRLDEFLVADIRKGTLVALKLDPKTGARLERTVVTGFHRPYLVAACRAAGLVAVSERGSETGREPCVKVLEPGWNTLRVLGVCSGMGPVLSCPWGICIDAEGNVLVADWGEQHRVVLYPARGVGRPLVTQGLSSPRGLALLPDGGLVVSDSMHHCVKIYQYK